VNDRLTAWSWWWALAAVWWTLNGFASATNYRVLRGSVGDPVTWAHALATSMTSALLWVPLTVMAFWLAERFPLARERLRGAVAVHLAAATCVCLVRATAVVVLNPWVGWYPTLPPFTTVLATSFQNNFFLYGLLTGVAHALHYGRKYRERETQLVQARLDVLKAQLHPHFLFNTLNTISSLVHHDAAAADRMIARLSGLLRRTLDEAGTSEVPLRDELAFLESYLEIEQARFEDRLTVCWAVDPAALDARVPHLILQPLVENAIRHGIAPRAAPGVLRIAAERVNGSLRLEVRDDGVGLGASPRAAGRGVGLRNTRARLAELYGEDHRLDLREARAGGTVLTMVIPFRPAHRQVGGDGGNGTR
jgi:two-component system, LytTR family, sensor kinase